MNRLTVDDVIVYIAARFGSTDAKEFTLQQQNVKTKAATKYAVKECLLRSSLP
jgi:hypothetical protein